MFITLLTLKQSKQQAHKYLLCFQTREQIWVKYTDEGMKLEIWIKIRRVEDELHECQKAEIISGCSFTKPEIMQS